jgi:hypothetical protein
MNSTKGRTIRKACTSPGGKGVPANRLAFFEANAPTPGPKMRLAPWISKLIPELRRNTT